jgi:glucosamine kinase
MKNNQIKYLIGVDAGGTKCIASITDIDGNIIGKGIAGPANIGIEGVKSINEILACTKLSLHNANILDDELGNCAVAIGIAGLEIPNAKNIISSWDHPYASMFFTSDMHTACLGAHKGEDGSILNIGTGIASCEVKKSTHVIKGGWGFPMADIGSGAWLGLRCIQELLCAIDGIRTHSPLTLSILSRFNGANEILIWAETATSSQYATFAKIAVKHYKDSDQVATQLINEMISHVESFLQMLFNSNPQRVSIVGGLAEFVQPLLNKHTKSRLSKPFGDATIGALQLAKSLT